MNWQPITTAPREKRILGLVNGEPEWVYGCPDGLNVEPEWTFDETGESCAPTHWLDIPPAPETGK